MADMSLRIEMRNQYLTIRGKRDGLGAQLLAQLSGLAYCEYHSLTYVHSPFEKVAHGLTAATVSAAEAFFGIGVGEPNIGDSSVASLNIEERLFMPEVLFSSKPETFYTDSFRQRLRTKYYQKPKPDVGFSANRINVCMHIRRGDVNSRRRFKGRYTSDEQHLAVLSKIKALNPDAMIHIFSEGHQSDFVKFASLSNIRLCLNWDVLTTFHAMVCGDILIPAKSSYSYCAGLLSENTVVCDCMTNFLTFAGQRQCLPLGSWPSANHLEDSRCL